MPDIGVERKGDMSIELEERLVKGAVNTCGTFQVSRLLEEALSRIIQTGTLDEPSVPLVSLDVNAVADELEEALSAGQSAIGQIEDAINALRAAEEKQKKRAA